MSKRVGKQTVKLNHPVSILSSAAIVGQKEKDLDLRNADRDRSY